MCRADNVPRTLVPNTRLASTERGLFKLSSVTPGKSLSRDLCEDFGGFSSTKNCVIVHSEDVVDSTDAKTNSVCGS